MNKLTVEEKVFIAAAGNYAKAKGIPITKMCWVLSFIMNMPENNVLHRLRELGKDLEADQMVEAVRYQLEEECENDALVDEILEKKIGEPVLVEVLSVRTYGAVCQVVGTTRTLLLHLSEIGNAFIDNIGDYISIGDKFNAILIVNKKGQLGLSARRFAPLEKKTIDMFPEVIEE